MNAMEDPSPKILVGIDNGASGAVAAISAATGKLITHCVVPTRIRRGKTEIDPVCLRKWIESLEDPHTGVWVEEPLHRAASSQSLRSMAINFGLIYGALQTAPFVAYVRPVQVIDWHRSLIPDTPQGKSKVAALKLARALEPDEQWLASPRCRTPHDGIVDAFLIARFGWLGGQAPPRKRTRKTKG